MRFLRVIGFAMACIAKFAGGAAIAQEAIVPTVYASSAQVIESGDKRAVVVCALGTVYDSGWTSGKLVPWTYKTAPSDGVQDFSFVATKRDAVSIPCNIPIIAVETLSDAPSWIKRVRIHAAHGTIESDLTTDGILQKLGPELMKIVPQANDGIEFDVQFKESNDSYEITGTIKASAGPLSHKWTLSGVKISKDATMASGEEQLIAGLSLEWKLTRRGKRVCLKARACYDPPFGRTNCTGWSEKCKTFD